MSTIPRPDTTDEMVLQLWFAIIGSNGDGLATKIKTTAEKVERIEEVIPTLMTRAEHDKKDADAKSKIERRKLRPMDKFNIAMGVVMAIFALAQVVAMFRPAEAPTAQTVAQSSAGGAR